MLKPALIKLPLDLLWTTFDKNRFVKLPLGFDKLAIGASLDKLAIGAGLYQNRGRPAVDKLLMRRNSGSGLRGLDLRVGPSGWSWP